VSRKTYGHPRPFECVCGAKQLVREETEIPEEGDGFTGVRSRLRFSDWYAPDKLRSSCAMCGRQLHQVFADLPRARDAVFVDGRRVV